MAVLNAFGIDDARFKRALGKKDIDEVHDLSRWVLSDSGALRPSQWTCRHAPSIIARSEAELFGISMPRFAIRIYLDKDCQSFINARRIGEFCDQARSWAKRKPGAKGRLTHVRRRLFAARPAWVHRKNTCIADSLLRFRGPSDYHVLEAELGTAYGEGEIWGTPYVQHISLTGGGLCAQATCFMATALLRDYCKGAYGVAEVTALAAPREAEELLLTGLDMPRMMRYFGHELVGLNATYQIADPPPWYPKYQPFQDALTAYVRSGFPVILPLDSGRMAGDGSGERPLRYEDSIYCRNNVKQPRRSEMRPKRHAVLVVGCDQRGEFLLNDPSTFPFLKASVHEIVAASCYFNPKMNDLRSCVFMPVTPAEVLVPLESYWGARGREDGDVELADKKRGLLHMVQVLNYKASTLGLPPLRPPWHFRLARAKDLATCEILPPEAIPGLQRAVEMWADQHPGHWCWVHVAGGSAVCIWDAERVPPPPDVTDEVIEQHVVTVLVREQGQWQPVLPGFPERANPLGSHQESAAPVGGPAAESSVRDQPTPVPCRPNTPVTAPFAKTALISSFWAGSLARTLENWPDDMTPCDLYAFMQPDADKLFPQRLGPSLGRLWQHLAFTLHARLRNLARKLWRYRAYRSGKFIRWKWIAERERRPLAVSPPLTTATERMASVGGRWQGAVAARIAKHLDGLLKNKGIPCVGLTTFIPEVTASGWRGRRSIRALRFLVRLARELKKLGHPITTIELVAGSLVDGVWPGIDDNAEHPRERLVYAASLLPREVALDRLLNALASVGHEAREAGVQFAIELEPGPIFVLGEWNELRDICNPAKNRYNVDLGRESAALNLDIAHWALAQAEPGQVRRCPEVMRLIGHCHISDHGPGHFGDVEVGRIHPDKHFLTWLAAVKEAASRPDRPSAFSGFVSVELEACKELGMIRRSLAKVSTFLRQL